MTNTSKLYFISSMNGPELLYEDVAPTLNTWIAHRLPIFYYYGGRDFELVWGPKLEAYECGMIGYHIDAMAEIAAAIVELTCAPFPFSFNTSVVIAGLGDTPEDIVAKYRDIGLTALNEYWTPERLAEQAAEDAAQAAKIKAHFLTLDNVDTLTELLTWFLTLEGLGGLTPPDRKAVAPKCLEFGVEPGMNCLPLGQGGYNDPFDYSRKAVEARTAREEWNSKPWVYRLQWLLGQCLDGTMRHGCPHQVCHKFAEDLIAEREAAAVEKARTDEE